MSTQIPREKAVFCEAVEITDPEQRRQFLDQACGADKALREQVERLFALSQSAGAFFQECAPALEPEAAEVAQVLSAAESALEADPLEAQSIGPYKLLQKLGEGGYGVVYMADQEQPIRRRVALKIIKLGMDTKNVIARFEAERQALALMDHPNIARVLDAGATDTGRPYFVMELVYGVKITEYCDQNRVSMQERLELFVQICNAVQHAHQKGIIHRDLKPSNIMVTMHDGVPVPKVIDFGIAKATEQRLTDKTLFTSYAQLMGTPAYMSPEQMELSGLNLDTRSDIYSLGVLLYELLTGRTPFDTSELLKSGVDELRRTLREQEAMSPSAKLKTLANDELTKTAKLRRVEPPRFLSLLHGDLDWIVLKCLEKDRTRRYETANALALDIEHYLREEPVLARPPSQWYRLQKLVRRNRMVFLFGVAAIAALLLGTVFSTIMFVKERKARKSEARLRTEAEAREMASRIAMLVSQRRFEEADKVVASLALDKPSIEAATALRGLGDWHAANGRWAEAAARFESVLKVNQLDAADVVAEDPLKLAAALLEAGDRHAYEQFRQAEFDKLGPAGIAADYRLFTASLLLPLDTNGMRMFLPVAEAAAEKLAAAEQLRLNSPQAVGWSKALALWEYRQGHIAQDVDFCFNLKQRAPDDAALNSATFFIRAMSGWRLGQFESAMVDWTVGRELLQAKAQQGLHVEKIPNLFPGAQHDLEGLWQDWVIADVLRRECDEVIAQTDRSSGAALKANTDSEAIAFRELGKWHAIRGEWELASRCLKYVRFPEDDYHISQNYYDQALAALKLGNQAEFIRLRNEVIGRFKDAPDNGAAVNVLNLTLLLPPDDTAMTGLQPFVEFLKRAEPGAEQNKDAYASWHLMLLGLFEYRRGNYAQASDLCRRSLDFCKYVSIPTIQDRAIMAMSFHKLGDDANARAELQKARSLAETGLNVGVDSWNWREWISVRILLQEADGLIPQTKNSE